MGKTGQFEGAAVNVRIILADEDSSVRQTQRRILETEPCFEVIGEAHNGRELIQLVEQARPDIVIMEVNLPEINGFETMRRLHRSYPELKAIVFSSYVKEAYVLAMLKSGASGYMSKQSPVNELGKAIRAVLRGQAYVSQSLHSILINEILRMDKEKGAM
jgi:two-component system, NarL family, response regulator DegU